MKIIVILLAFVVAVTYGLPPGFHSATANAAVNEIRHHEQQINPDGSFVLNFETSDGTSIQQQGSLKNAGHPEQETQEVTGAFKYTTPDGQIFEVRYVANELGYQPSGEHLPTPPPIPDAIQRALAWIEAHPEVAVPAGAVKSVVGAGRRFD